jgi:putative thioredoxin
LICASSFPKTIPVFWPMCQRECQAQSGRVLMNRDNPYGTAANTYATQVTLGDRPAPAPVKEVTTASFQADVLHESRRQTVLVDFWAPWCGPCKQLAPVLEKAVQESGGAVKLVKMNIDDHPAIAGQLGIQSIPAVIAFRDGQPVDGFIGVLSEREIKAFLKRVGGNATLESQIEEAIAAARQALDGGDTMTARQIYAAILERMPDHPDAVAGMAELLAGEGAVDKARALLDGVPADRQEAPAIAAVRAKIALAEQVAGLGDPKELAARIEADPKDHQARFDLALILNAQGRREEAAEHLLTIIQTDRHWKDDAARAQLIQFFEAWGPNDEVTLKARRRLSSILFS